MLCLHECFQDGNTPLHMSAEVKFGVDSQIIAAIKVLLNAGADPSVKNFVSD